MSSLRKKIQRLIEREGQLKHSLHDTRKKLKSARKKLNRQLRKKTNVNRSNVRVSVYNINTNSYPIIKGNTTLRNIRRVYNSRSHNAWRIEYNLCGDWVEWIGSEPQRISGSWLRIDANHNRLQLYLKVPSNVTELDEDMVENSIRNHWMERALHGEVFYIADVDFSAYRVRLPDIQNIPYRSCIIDPSISSNVKYGNNICVVDAIYNCIMMNPKSRGFAEGKYQCTTQNFKSNDITPKWILQGFKDIGVEIENGITIYQLKDWIKYAKLPINLYLFNG